MKFFNNKSVKIVLGNTEEHADAEVKELAFDSAMSSKLGDHPVACYTSLYTLPPKCGISILPNLIFSDIELGKSIILSCPLDKLNPMELRSSLEIPESYTVHVVVPKDVDAELLKDVKITMEEFDTIEVG